jgi:hypothetical protein
MCDVLRYLTGLNVPAPIFTLQNVLRGARFKYVPWKRHSVKKTLAVLSERWKNV